MADLKKQFQRPEGKLIEDALKKAPKKSMRKLAEEIGRSEGRVRQIVNGYQSHGDGQVVAIVGPADTVASMAKAAGVTPEQMRQAGRDDVADEMHPLRGVGVTEEGELWLSSHEEEFNELRAWVETPDDKRSDGPPVCALVLWQADELIAAAHIKYEDELRLKDYFINMLSDRPSLEERDRLEARVEELEAALSDPSTKTDYALAADLDDDAAGESESYNET